MVEEKALNSMFLLGLLDWVIDPGHQRLIANPEHGGAQIMEAERKAIREIERR